VTWTRTIELDIAVPEGFTGEQSDALVEALYATCRDLGYAVEGSESRWDLWKNRTAPAGLDDHDPLDGRSALLPRSDDPDAFKDERRSA
jgi:hypothetical protein